jgi:hypothetical protein
MINEESKIASLYQKVYLKEDAQVSVKGKQLTKQPEVDAQEIVKAAEPALQKIDKIEDEMEEIGLQDLPSQLKGSHKDIRIDKGMAQLPYRMLYALLNQSYNTKKPLLIYGDPGIGKSEIVQNTSEQIANKKNKIYKQWAKLSKEERGEVINNPEKYFIFIDQRAASLEPTDFSGIPSITDPSPYLVTKQWDWIFLFSKPDSDGLLFLDEINQGDEQVLKSLFKVVLDKQAGDTAFSKNIAVMAAGNLGAEFGNRPIPLALTNRFKAGLLVADPEGWFEYAIKRNPPINSNIIAFVRADPSENFYVKPVEGSSEPYATPRQIVAFSDEMRNNIREFSQYYQEGKSKDPYGNTLMERIATDALGLCGEFWATKFLTFLDYSESFDLDKLSADAKNLNKKKNDEIYALVPWMKDLVQKAAKETVNNNNEVTPNAEKIFTGIATVAAQLKKDAFITWFVIMEKQLPSNLFAAAMRYWGEGQYDPNIRKALADKLNAASKTLTGED